MRLLGEDTPDPTWDSVVASFGLAPIWRQPALEALTRAGRMRIVTARAVFDEETVALACYRTPANGFFPVTRRRRSRLQAALWICSPPISFDRGLVFGPGTTTSDRARIRTRVDRAVSRRLGGAPRVIGHPHLAIADLDTLQCSRLVVKTAPTAILDIRWPSLQHYLSGLTKRRERRLRRLIDEVDGRGLDRLSIDDGHSPPSSFCDLEQQTRARHLPARRLPPALPDDYVTAMAGTGGSGFFGYRSARGRLLQADLAFVEGDRLTITATASEERDIAGGLYEAIMLDEIDWAIRRGLDRVAVGAGSMESKLRFGCRVAEQFMTVRAV